MMNRPIPLERSLFSLSYLVILWLIFSGISTAQGQTNENPPTFDPQAMDIIKSFADSWKQVQGFKAEIEFTQNPVAGPVQQEDVFLFQLLAQKPNLLHYEITVKEPIFTLISDGQQLFSRFAFLRQHVIEPAPATLDRLVEKFRMNPYVNAPIVMALLSVEPYDALTKDMQAIRLEKTGQNDGKTIYQIAMQHPEYDEHIQFEKQNDQITLQQIIQDFVEITSEPGSSTPNRKPVYRLTWQIRSLINGEPIPPTTFAITPDTTTSLARFLGEIPPEQHPLLGRMAPELSLISLSGSKVDLADHVNHQVVVLDFWASWCGPCRQALPIMNRIAENYRSQNSKVVFYAVNQSDASENISSIWKQAGFSLPVLFDPNKQAGKRYGVNGIPHTVVIGFDGTIQSIHVGLLPTLDLTLSGEIDYLLSGKKLIEK